MGPMFNGDYGAGAIAEWAEYNKLQGVTKVCVHSAWLGQLGLVQGRRFGSQKRQGVGGVREA